MSEKGDRERERKIKGRKRKEREGRRDREREGRKETRNEEIGKGGKEERERGGGRREGVPKLREVESQRKPYLTSESFSKRMTLRVRLIFSGRD